MRTEFNRENINDTINELNDYATQLIKIRDFVDDAWSELDELSFSNVNDMEYEFCKTINEIENNISETFGLCKNVIKKVFEEIDKLSDI